MNVELIHRLCDLYNIRTYTINDDLTIDVFGLVDLGGLDLQKLPLVFNRVEGNFICSYNNLTNLVGSPRYISGDFICAENILSTLVGGPDYIGGYFDFSYNHISSLKGCPLYIGELS